MREMPPSRENSRDLAAKEHKSQRTWCYWLGISIDQRAVTMPPPSPVCFRSLTAHARSFIHSPPWQRRSVRVSVWMPCVHVHTSAIGRHHACIGDEKSPAVGNHPSFLLHTSYPPSSPHSSLLCFLLCFLLFVLLDQATVQLYGSWKIALYYKAYSASFPCSLMKYKCVIVQVIKSAQLQPRSEHVSKKLFADKWLDTVREWICACIFVTCTKMHLYINCRLGIQNVNKFKVIWGKGKSLLVSIRQVAPPFAFACFGRGVRHPNIFFAYWSGTPSNTMCMSLEPTSYTWQMAAKSVERFKQVHECDRRQTDRQTALRKDVQL